ncbi:Formin-like protein [Oopsacas minuta]|uniref:Formin-like protein n=1 Tax=Oopsacas minuta TaxID=111878 RepID=A0AAV7JN15_9METZ|nr:Formin-like protein [Oopsacas minuta]
MGNNPSGQVRTARSREDLVATPPEIIKYQDDFSLASTSNPEASIASPIQFENYEGVKFDANDVPLEDFELVTHFDEFLNRMNIPNSQKQLMMSYPRERKLTLLNMECGTKSTDPAKCLKYILLVQEADKKRVRKKANDTRFLQALQDLEISLRTNNIHWVENFLDQHNGLEYLIDYIKFRIDYELQMKLKTETRKLSSTIHPPATSSLRTIRDRSIKSSPHVNDLHICLLCLKAIMNNTTGLQAILGHRECLTHMTRVMLVSQLRTSTLILDILSAVCHIEDLNGHQKVIEAVDSFSQSKGEAHRFQTLVYHFYDNSCPIEFRISCLGFIYYLCNSAPDVKYRVRLYHEFAELGLDDFLDGLDEEETHARFLELSIAYRDNNIDVKELLDTYNLSDEMTRELEDLKLKSEEAEKKYTACEFESIKKIANLERESQQLTDRLEKAELQLEEKKKEESILSTRLEQQAANYEEKLKKQSTEITQSLALAPEIKSPIKDTPPSTNQTVVPPEPEKSIVIPSPPPDLPEIQSSIPAPPPDIGDFSGSSKSKDTPNYTQPISLSGEKRRIQTNYRLPVLNWCTVTKAQVDGTIFSELDDEKLLKTLDFREFEETFKTKAQPKQEQVKKEGPSSKAVKVLQRIGTPKAVQPPVFLETNRVRNIGIAMKRFGKDAGDIRNAINRMDTCVLNSEYVELLAKLVPNENEEKAMDKYNKEYCDKNAAKLVKTKPKLLQEEKFLLELHSVDRLSAKLEVMLFLCGCEDELERLQTQLDCASTASHAVLSSQSFKKIMELVLAFGNYMNSSKRGAVYGFRLESLDVLNSTLSTDKKQSLLHYIAKTVKDRNPEYTGFVTEMRYLQKASLVIMDNLDADIQDLMKQCERAVRELVYDKQNTVLKNFLLINEPKVTKLSEDYKLAKTTYLKCGKYLGEDSSCLKSNTMFQQLNKFRLHFERVEKENEHRKMLEKSQEEIAMKRQRPSIRKAEEKTIGDMQHDAAYDGAVDDIIQKIKSGPYRAENMVSRRRDTPKRRRQRSQRALTSEQSFSEDLPRSDSLSGIQSSNRARGRSWGQQGVIVNLESDKSIPELTEESTQGEVRAKKDAMGQPIHDSDSSQDEYPGKGTKQICESREAQDLDKPSLSNKNPSFNPGNVSPTRVLMATEEHVANKPLFVNDIAAMFAKPVAQVDASSDFSQEKGTEDYVALSIDKTDHVIASKVITLQNTDATGLFDNRAGSESKSSEKSKAEQGDTITHPLTITESEATGLFDNRAGSESKSSDESKAEQGEENLLRDKFLRLNLDQEEIELLIEQGDRFVERPPLLLARRLNIHVDKAKLIIVALKDFKNQEQVKNISKGDIDKIEECLKDPEFSTPEDISLISGIDLRIIVRYLQNKPLDDKQKTEIREKYNTGCSMNDIVMILGLPEIKVKEYVESTLLSFTSEDGRKCLQIIQSNFSDYTCPEIELRRLITSNNLKLQDKLCCILQIRNTEEYLKLRHYFEKFEESKSFFHINTELTMEDISLINQYSLSDIEHLSIKLNKVESAIREYLEQYHPNQVVNHNNSLLQNAYIQQFLANFGGNQLTFHSYRMIITNSFEEMIRNAEITENQNRLQKIKVFDDLLPLAFYYLKCSLPFNDLTQIIANASKMLLTTHDLFHLIFQLSDPVLKGFCIEHYSFSNPVPFYYPKLQKTYQQTHAEFTICKELWYSMQQFNGLVSFGLGRAGWNPIGKSHLLDLIFETDFVKGNPQNSAFHFNSIDIQMTKNLFGEKKENSGAESIKWAYIDCNGHSNKNIIKIVCQYLDIALIQITNHDYENNKQLLNNDIYKLTNSVKHVYLLIRDYPGNEVKVEVKQTEQKSIKNIFIPNLTKPDTNFNSVIKSLKGVGYDILHPKSETSKMIGSEFIENVMKDLDPHSLKEIESEKVLIQNITDCVSKSAKSSKVGFSFLQFYPLYVDYMSCYHRANSETEYHQIKVLNNQRGILASKLNKTNMGDIVKYFNDIICRENSSLIMWKLSQHLSLLSKQINFDKNRIIEQKNDKYTIEILWREALLSYKYCTTTKDFRGERYIDRFGCNYSNHVERGEPFELIDGDNLRFFNQDIDNLLSRMYQRQFEKLKSINKDQKISMKQAPIVVSIVGPQSSGKSTLLNYSFGCKFLTSAGRCTRGIYASLSKLSHSVNLMNQLLILDTEGLDAIERGNIKDTSLIHFDRTMVLFCLAVSQVVIINVRGDIGVEMQNLLQICAYSLNKLKVRKVTAPQIFFVLNQQADPDPDKHLDSINILMEKLNRESNLIDTERAKMSDLIHISRENLFVLPSAFNSEQINKPGLNLFDSKIIKLSPTITFADKCADLRFAIIKQLYSMSLDKRTPFQTMSEWMKMSGTIWDTIIRYQDIVKYKNVEEMICSNFLKNIISELMDTHIYCHKDKFLEMTENFLREFKQLTFLIILMKH